MAIRYDKKFNQEIKTIINKYNAKVRRQQKKGASYTPEIFSKEALNSLKASTVSRRDIRRELKTLQDYTARGGEKLIKFRGTSIPKFQLQSIKRLRRAVSRKILKKEKFYKETKPTILGIETDFTLAEQFDTEYANILALKERLIDYDYFSIDQEMRQDYLRKLTKNARDIDLATWQERYADMLLDVGYLYNIPHEDINKFREELLNLTPQKFNELFNTESIIKDILYAYQNINNIGIDLTYENTSLDMIDKFYALFENENKIIDKYK